MRSRHRRLADEVAEMLLLRASLGRRAAARLEGWDCIVYYHSVGHDAPHLRRILKVRSLDGFERDMRLLRSCFDVVPLSHLTAATAARGREPRVAVCFDDGLDLYAPGVADILKRHSVLATVFVVTNCVDNRKLMWRNAIAATVDLTAAEALVSVYRSLAQRHGLRAVSSAEEIPVASREWPNELKDALASALWNSAGMGSPDEYLRRHRPYMTMAELMQWVEEGNSVGLHTASHPYCDRLNEQEVQSEVVEPAEWLRKTFGMDSVPFAYPFGVRFPRSVEEALIARGVISCALGGGGFFRRDRHGNEIPRREVDSGVVVPMILRPLLGRR